MSGIDKAFIKAYRQDPAGHGPAAPHSMQQARDAVTVGQDVESQTASSQGEAPSAGAVPAHAGDHTIQERRASIDNSHTAVNRPHWSTETMATFATGPIAEPVPMPPWAKPAYEVAEFIWPETCRQLVSAIGGQLDTTIKALLDRSRDGKKAVLVSGTGRGEGTTTVLLCLAQRLAAVGVKCVVVDANFESPNLVQMLGIAPVAGWEGVAREQCGVGEVMIQSAVDRLAVLPLCGPLADARSLANDLHWPVTMTTLKQHYQVVLIDGPSTVSGASSAISSLGVVSEVESAIFVSSDANGALFELTEATNRFTSAGTEVLGVVENLCRSVPHSQQNAYHEYHSNRQIA